MREVLAATKIQPPLIGSRFAESLSIPAMLGGSVQLSSALHGVVTPRSSKNMAQA